MEIEAISNSLEMQGFFVILNKYITANLIWMCLGKPWRWMSQTQMFMSFVWGNEMPSQGWEHQFCAGGNWLSSFLRCGPRMGCIPSAPLFPTCFWKHRRAKGARHHTGSATKFPRNLEEIMWFPRSRFAYLSGSVAASLLRIICMTALLCHLWKSEKWFGFGTNRAVEAL